MMLGWLMASLSMGVLLLVSDLSLQEDEFVNDEGELDNRIVAPENAPSIPLLSLTTLLFGTGFWYVVAVFRLSVQSFLSENCSKNKDGRCYGRLSGS